MQKGVCLSVQRSESILLSLYFFFSLQLIHLPHHLSGVISLAQYLLDWLGDPNHNNEEEQKEAARDRKGKKTIGLS